MIASICLQSNSILFVVSKLNVTRLCCESIYWLYSIRVLVTVFINIKIA